MQLVQLLLEKFEPDLDWDVNFNGSFYGIESPLSFLFEFIHSQSKVTGLSYFQAEVGVCVCGLDGSVC